MINIGICDDIDQMRHIVIEMCEYYSKDNNINFSYREFSSGVQVVECEEQIDILLQDIAIPDISGIEVMEKIIDKDNIELIIFVTGYDNYSKDVFSSKTRGFIKKPIDYNDFEKNINRAVKELERRKIIEFQTEKNIVYIRNADLIFIETMGNYLKVYCTNSIEHIVYGSMKYWSEKLEDYDIIRISNSYMVNLKYVDEWDKTINIKKVNKSIRVGRGYYENGNRLYRKYIKRKLKELL